MFLLEYASFVFPNKTLETNKFIDIPSLTRYKISDVLVITKENKIYFISSRQVLFNDTISTFSNLPIKMRFYSFEFSLFEYPQYS